MDTSPSQNTYRHTDVWRISTFCQRLFGKHNPRECWTGWKSYSGFLRMAPFLPFWKGTVGQCQQAQTHCEHHPSSLLSVSWYIHSHLSIGITFAHNQGRQDAPPAFRESEFVDFKTVSVLQCLAHCLLETMHNRLFELPCKSFGPYQLMLKILATILSELWWVLLLK